MVVLIYVDAIVRQPETGEVSIEASNFPVRSDDSRTCHLELELRGDEVDNVRVGQRLTLTIDTAE